MTPEEMRAEAERRTNLDLPCVVCRDRPLREMCARCLAHDLAVELEQMTRHKDGHAVTIREITAENKALRKRVVSLEGMLRIGELAQDGADHD